MFYVRWVITKVISDWFYVILVISYDMCLVRSKKYQFNNLVWPDSGLNPRSTALDASQITITPPIRFIKSPKQRLETSCFCSVSYYYFSYYYSYSYFLFFPWTMNLSTADRRNYRTEFHETWWSYKYMFLVDPKVFRFVVKGVKAIFLGVQMGWRLQ